MKFGKRVQRHGPDVWNTQDTDLMGSVVGTVLSRSTNERLHMPSDPKHPYAQRFLTLLALGIHRVAEDNALDDKDAARLPLGLIGELVVHGMYADVDHEAPDPIALEEDLQYAEAAVRDVADAIERTYTDIAA